MMNSPVELNELLESGQFCFPAVMQNVGNGAATGRGFVNILRKIELESCAADAKNLKKAKKKMEFFTKTDYF